METKETKLEDCLMFNFLEKKMDDPDGNEMKDYVFHGMRMSEDVMYRMVYLLSEFLGVDRAVLCTEDEEGYRSAVINPGRLFSEKYPDFVDDEEIEDDILDS